MGFYGNYYVNDAFLFKLKEDLNNKIDEVDKEETSQGVYWEDKS